MAELKPYPTMKDSGVEWLGMVPEHWEVRKLRTYSALRKKEPFNPDLVERWLRSFFQLTQTSYGTIIWSPTTSEILHGCPVRGRLPQSKQNMNQAIVFVWGVRFTERLLPCV